MTWICAKCKTEHWRDSDGSIYYLDAQDWELEKTKYLCTTCYNKAKKYVDGAMQEMYRANRIRLMKEFLNERRPQNDTLAK